MVIPDNGFLKQSTGDRFRFHAALSIEYRQELKNDCRCRKVPFFRPMSFREKAIKIGSTIFMTFIVALIIIAFGMPDFISTSAESQRNLVARVDDLNIYPSDIGQQKQAIQAQFGGENLPQAFMAMIESQALERAIQQKLFYVMTRDSHLVPKGSARTRALGDFYRENLSSFMSDGKFDFNSFEKTLARQNRTRVEFDNSAVQQVSMDTLRRLVNDINFTSVYDAAESRRLASGRLSLRIIALDTAAKESLVSRRLKIADSEIQERFKRDYLSKDPKDTLTSVKREAITAQLRNEKKPAFEQELTEKLNKMTRLGDVSAETGIKSIELRKIALNESLESKKPKDAPALAELEKSEAYLSSVFRVKPGEMFQATTDTAVYFVEIFERELPTLPTAAEIKAAAGNLENLVKDETIRKSIVTDSSGTLHWNNALEVMMELMKKNTAIRRFKEQNS